MIKAIFFDFDGTICDSRKLVWDSMYWLFNNGKISVNKKKLDSVIGEKFEQMEKDLGFSENISHLRKRFYSHIVKETDAAKLHACASILPLRELKKKYPLVVISNAQSIFTKKCAKKMGVYDLFDNIYGGEDFKSKDQFMKKLFRKYNLRPNEVIYIGDRFSDVRYAKRAGCWAVSIYNKCSWSSMKQILKEKPDFMVKDFVGLKKVVERINSLSSN